MVSLDEVHKNNASLKDYGPNLVAVFGTTLHSVPDNFMI